MSRSLQGVFPVCLACLSFGCFSPNQKLDPEASSDETAGASADSTATTANTTGNPAETVGPSGTTGSSEATGSSVTRSDDTSSSADPTNTTVEDATGATDPSEGPPGCGNGELDGDEECDDGPDNGTEGCTEQCLLPFCGDELVSPGEMCDDGVANGLGLGDCAPDCSKTVDAKTITVSVNYSTNGDMGGGAAVDHVDGRCEAAGLVGYKAMFADGTNRRASVSPFVGDGQIDWVLTPWTRYLTEDGDLVWTTDASALLGVRDGAPEPLLVPITTNYARAYTGLQPNWLAELSSDCNNWTTNSSGASTYLGQPDELVIDRVLAGVTPELSPGNCVTGTVVYCVDQ
ncbi:MAG: DUF1554 domain-containing protein [Nannocystaceae bacterium]|nr:DUF1554 domain-containing protein [Nannocystaceae bacterium]